MMKLTSKVLLISLALPSISGANIPDALRRDKAVALYQFRETSGDIIDSADPKFGAPLNLRPYFGGIVRAPGVLRITEPNLIASVTNADKITNQCRASKGMTFEVWLENAESVEVRSGQDALRRDQPLRILSLGSGLLRRNFMLGQFYDAGNQYRIAVNTSANENNTNRLGGSLVEPLVSTTAETIISSNDAAAKGHTNLQKVIFSVSQSGIGRLYLSDRKGNMYLAETSTAEFNAPANTFFDTWRTGSFLTLGNEYMTQSEASTRFSQNDNFASCTTSQCQENPNRFWKGSLHLVAVYCESLTSEQILGIQTVQQILNPIIPVSETFSITPELQLAQELYQRIASTKLPLTSPLLQQMATLIASGNRMAAAQLVVEQSHFYNITLRDFASQMSNRDETINVPLNDFTATVIGAVRDNLSAKTLLTGNYVYIADATKAAIPSDWENDILRSNSHYIALGSGRYDLAKVLVRTEQRLFNGASVVNNPTPAGLLTTRQWMAAHAIAGTNRRLVEYSLKQFLCTPLEKAADSEGPDDVVGRDIDRYPGGVHSKYSVSCKSCHTVMDGLRPAFSHFTFSNNFVKHSYLVPLAGMNDDEEQSMGMKQQPRYIASKLNHNSTVFPAGRETKDDAWVNNANRGSNADHFGWNRTSGKGINDYGKLLADSKAFPRCLAERVFKTVCKRAPAASEMGLINTAATEFSSQQNYNLKYLFQRLATSQECLGQ